MRFSSVRIEKKQINLKYVENIVLLNFLRENTIIDRTLPNIPPMLIKKFRQISLYLSIVFESILFY